MRQLVGYYQYVVMRDVAVLRGSGVQNDDELRVRHDPVERRRVELRRR